MSAHTTTVGPGPGGGAAPPSMDEGFRLELERVAHAPVLLVAMDFDGTISEIVSDPAAARPDQESLVAVRALAALAQTHVAVISGRELKDLGARLGLPESVRLVGSHGSEFDPSFAERLPAGAVALRARLVGELKKIALSAAAPVTGPRPHGPPAAVAQTSHGFMHPAGANPAHTPPASFLVEEKPASVALHYRNAPEGTARAALAAVLAGPASYPGVHVRHGKMVVELGVVEMNKGKALQSICRQVGASINIFIGDDDTDEEAFATLGKSDLGIKVGPGQTLATRRISGPVEVARVLAHLVELRRSYLEGAASPSIESHSVLFDGRTAAMVTPGARVVWMCLPRIDSPAVFAELLGGAAAGHFSIRPETPTGPARQRYVGDTFVLETSWEGLRVTDYLEAGAGRAFQRAGRTDLVRVLEGGGGGSTLIEFAPRADFGRGATKIVAREGGLEIDGPPDPMVLRSPGVAWEIVAEGKHQTARARVDLREGEPLVLELRYGTGDLRGAAAPERARREGSGRLLAEWVSHLRFPAGGARLRPELLRRSALVLKGLCYGPTGAIMAAPTSSLPEHFGGVRNWDYRFCWPRDAALAASALARLGSVAEGMRLLDWLLGVLDRADSPERLRPVYTVTGSELGAEGEIPELPGYRGSRPVRVGNAAGQQVQLDVFGPIVELVALLAERGAPLAMDHWRLVESIVTAVANRWEEPDHGIWEVRRGRRHHVHSKAMCWLAVDRGAALSESFLGRERPDWKTLRDRIGRDVLEKAWRPDLGPAGSFAATYEEAFDDASVLALGLTGLIAPTDERFVRTVEAVERGLRRGPTVYRYRYDDGLPGGEGGFNLCTGWLIESYALIGRADLARELYESFAALAGPTGLLPEEYEPTIGQGAGNHPQAYSHLALLNAAWRLADPAGG